MRIPQLDERLRAAAELFTACEFGADIGADHGRLSCYLLDRGICGRMVVSDISADSLQKARRLLTLHGLQDRVVFKSDDGLEAIVEPVQCVAICGMGGRLMADILSRGCDRLHRADLVLSCHTEIPELRRTVVSLGYCLKDERLVIAKGRYYVVIRAESGVQACSDKEYYLGPVLMRKKPVLWQPYLLWREGVVSCERGHDEYLKWIREEMEK